jgi:hypothetical protein
MSEIYISRILSEICTDAEESLDIHQHLCILPMSSLVPNGRRDSQMTEAQKELFRTMIVEPILT